MSRAKLSGSSPAFAALTSFSTSRPRMPGFGLAPSSVKKPTDEVVDEVEGLLLGLAGPEDVLDALDAQAAEAMRRALAVVEHQALVVVDLEGRLLLVQPQRLHGDDEPGGSEQRAGQVALVARAVRGEVVDDEPQVVGATLDVGLRQLPRGLAVGVREAERVENRPLHQLAQLLEGTLDQLEAGLALLGVGLQHLDAVVHEGVERLLLGGFARLELGGDGVDALLVELHRRNVLELLHGLNFLYLQRLRCASMSAPRARCLEDSSRIHGALLKNKLQGP
jgi:hypothetical protein